MNTLLEIFPFLIPVLIVDLVLAVTALIHVLKHPHYRFGNKVLWCVVVICVLMIGPIVYFVFGKGEEQ